MRGGRREEGGGRREEGGGRREEGGGRREEGEEDERKERKSLWHSFVLDGSQMRSGRVAAR